ncbi:GNAT family N-acetyltransferase [Aneurinibacillus tyrosinisolvens]|uniref:GNAT family N-acetyltransferase n=1 Tax=Aneurinibacillus tyrosinisolvens TaxID=1443435 RepID=UPI000699FFE5|nr:GNAT family N-acetyltransferase [Aneurinibacillus tyrosinisolvens]
MKHNYYVQGEDLNLRPVEENDLERIRAWRNKESIRTFFVYQQLIKPNQQTVWYADYLEKNNDIMFIIEEKKSLQRPIGAVALYNIDLKRLRAEFGRLMIGDSEANGKGLGLQATSLVCEFGFSVLGLKEIYLEVFAENQRAKRIYQSCGFINISTFERDGKRMLGMCVSK